ncbi:hypothetical protein [Marinicauda sp. Alg238-R41]|uniref:hypothetical protein n=1 Tax=Marinicauda sp. Alg238-R41 TaxID=2993447 RepID=UPI0022E81887|nr:hypothetical protein [Marinicauda sp. Alg238-R41]
MSDAAATKEKPSSAGTMLARVFDNPALPLKDKAAWKDLLVEIKTEAESLPKTLETTKDRETIKAAAYKVRRTKTAIDDAGKEMNRELREKINAVDADRRVIRDTLEGLAADIREPLTAWEEAEKAREAKADQIEADLKSASVITADLTAADLETRLETVRALEIEETIFGKRKPQADDLRDRTLQVLESALQRAKTAEAEALELAELRRKEEERQRQEEAARAEQERKAREEAEASRRVDTVIAHMREIGEGRIDGQTQPIGLLEYELESKVVIDETFGSRRAEAEAVRAETRAKLKVLAADAEAKRKAQEEADREAAAEKARADERARIDAERRRKEEDDAKAKADEERRAQDQKHRDSVMGRAVAALVERGLEPSDASTAVAAIADGAIPAVKIEF